MADLGRPTVMTPETIAKLEEGFIKGLSDREACLYADINPTTLYRFCEENPDFRERKELLKEQIKMKAKLNIARDIQDVGATPISQWLLERRDPDFKPKQETQAKVEAAITLNDEQYKQLISLANKRVDSQGGE